MADPPQSHEQFRAYARSAYGEDPAGYDTGRPEYPAVVFDTLRSRCGLRPGARVVESGPGTGQATRRLVEAGARVVAVEPDPAMAAHLRDRFGDRIEVLVAPFETAPLDRDRFDLAIAATSFHWVQQPAGAAQLARVLRPGGWAALWWTVFADPDRADPFLEALGQMLGEEDIGRQLRFRWPFEREARAAELTGAGLVEVTDEAYPWTASLGSEQMRALYGSMMDVRRRPADARAEILEAVFRLAEDRFGGRVDRPFVTALWTARKPSGV